MLTCLPRKISISKKSLSSLLTMTRIRTAIGLFTAFLTTSPRCYASANKTAFVSSESRSFTSRLATSTCNSSDNTQKIDSMYPGTAVERMTAVRDRVQQLQDQKKLVDSSWEDVRRRILWAGGLKDLPDAVPGRGYTGHSFNDFNHVDLTCMLDQVSDNENDGSVKGIAIGNRLGSGIRIASLEELGPGGRYVDFLQPSSLFTGKMEAK